ncbi:MAG: glycosyltransferase family 1 protein [Patescibacteria group bacterium]|nr:glycosyltransferase family 1 protein [Patescibacteria group bacterium]
MKIAIDTRSLEGAKTGVGRYLSNLLEYWRNNKEHQFTFYFKDNLPDSDLFKSDNFTKKLLKNPFGFSSNFFFQHFLLPYHLKKDKVDFFFSPFYLKPFYCPVKSAIVLHDISYEARPEWFNRKNRFVLKTLSRLSAKKTKAIFTVSNYSKKEIVDYYQLNPDKITVTHLAPDSGFYKIDDENKIKSVREKYSVQGKFILCVGSIFNRRHIPEIIEAFKKIAGKYSNYQLLVIGKNHTHPFVEINSKIEIANKNLGREAIIHFDFVSEEELLALYGSCEINIYLSDYEGFGLPVIEAQFFDKPVITSDNSSLTEVGGDSVEFVKNNTVEEICRSLEKVIADENYKKNLIKSGAENIKRFSWEKCARKTIERIESI